ncbi:MAG TPA: UvrD-helicase domain-containing protein, partial [Alphaproteobacteria bacterium]
VTSRLRHWAVTDAIELEKTLTDLLGMAPTPDQIDQARSLFAQVLDTPGSMKIMTIHAFCQSVLGRFPLEAGLPAGFQMMDDVQSRALMRDVRRDLIAHLLNETKDTAPKAGFQFLSALLSIDDLEHLMEKLSSERARLQTMVEAWGSIEALNTAVDAHLGVKATDTEDSLIAAFFENLPITDLQTLHNGLRADKGKTNQKYADILSLAINGPIALETYTEAFLKKTDGQPYQPTGILKNDPVLLSLWNAECERLQDMLQKRKSIYTALCTKSLLSFGGSALAAYQAEKRRRNLSDFEDLIVLTKKLLSGDGVHWVQYKLDQGIDHILVDEAQDTNPDQWDIITGLYDEFYSGLGTREDAVRTTFVVGDEKQSIYSFQRADPRIFAHQHDRLDSQTAAQPRKQETVYLNASFRSGASILKFVDTVFAPQTMMQGVVRPGTGPVAHNAADTGKASRVEIWPLFKNEAKRSKNSDPGQWENAWVIQGNAVQALANRIALTIQTWLKSGEKLESQDRTIEPGDILILLAKRAPLAEPILRALREAHIPVTGIDRMVLVDQIAVQDSLAALSFALAPDDDLTLASLLKSPFIGWDEDTLFALAHNRKTSLWDALRKDHAHKDVADWLSKLLVLAGSANPSIFLHHMFYTPCPADPISGMRALLHRLGADAVDPLQELLARADHYMLTGTLGLQGFLNESLTDTSEIKRQMDASGNRVRLMTVHGAKGLEAPIVFLPDTMRKNQSLNDVDALQWPDRLQTTKRENVPLWSTSAKDAAPELKGRLQNALERGEEEYRRLLYVALTRPAERLYIAGAQNGYDGGIDPQSWYFACQDAFEQMDLVHDGENGVRFIRNAQTSD